jgi:hypothetical protein
MNASQDTILEVDFNSVDALDRIVTSLRFSNQWERPDVGNWVRLADADGNVCIGQVEEVRNLIVAVRPEWTYWSSRSVTRPFIGGVAPTPPAIDQPVTAAAEVP